MSLYGDLPQAKAKGGDAAPPSTSAWSSLNKMQPAVVKKPGAAGPAFAPPPSVLRAAAAPAPGRGSGGRCV